MAEQKNNSTIDNTTDYRSRKKEELKGSDRYEYFYGKASPFSQHHLCQFVVDGERFNCAEQYMMYMKAVVFKDESSKAAIMKSKDPVQMKRLGRRVENFEPTVWNEKCIEVVKRGNEAKFSQNPDLKKQIFDTYPKMLVEASPRDTRWGIGLSAKNERAWDQKTWRGKNLLGFTLTEVRDELMKEENLID